MCHGSYKTLISELEFLSNSVRFSSSTLVPMYRLCFFLHCMSVSCGIKLVLCSTMIDRRQSYWIVLFGTINSPKNLVIIALILSALWEWMTHYCFIVYSQHTSYKNTTKIVLLPCVCARMYVSHTKTQYNYEWKWILIELYCSILICCNL